MGLIPSFVIIRIIAIFNQYLILYTMNAIFTIFRNIEAGHAGLPEAITIIVIVAIIALVACNIPTTEKR